jgi:predicted component of type VI protein secretion system
MSTARTGSPGATRVCPHCKATVLESAAVCPGCRHHLRFSRNGQALQAGEGYCALSVDGTIVHTPSTEPCEYCVVLDVRNDRGEQLTRQVVGVGVLRSGELRRLNVSVEMMPVRAQATGKSESAPSVSAAPSAISRPAAASIAAPVPAAAPPPAAASPQKAAAPPAARNGVVQPLARATPASILRLGIIRRPR